VRTYLFFLVVLVLVAVSGWQIYSSFFADKTPAVGDHIHAALGVNICGREIKNAPEFETQNGSDQKAGLHSHGDGLIHIHPFTDDEAGGNATVGRFFEYGGWEIGEDHIKLTNDDPKRNWADGVSLANGAPCFDGRPGKVRWKVNGSEESGNPGDYAPEDGDVIEIAFLPEGDAIPDPPAEVLAVLPHPSDVKQGG